MQTANLKISVISPTYNSEKYLSRAFDSLYNQTYKNFEHIIIDGGSNDNTLNIVESFKTNNMILISEKDTGIYNAINKGLNYVTGDIVGILNSDDYLCNKYYFENISKIFSKGNISGVYSDLIYINKSGKAVRRWKSSPYSINKICFGWMPPHPTLYIDKNWYKRIGGYDEFYRISSDYAMCLKLFLDPNFKAIYIPEVSVVMQLGGASNKSISNIFIKSFEDFAILKINNLRCKLPFFTLICKNLRKINQFFYK
jgi:glycosyltransferase